MKFLLTDETCGGHEKLLQAVQTTTDWSSVGVSAVDNRVLWVEVEEGVELWFTPAV